MRARLVQRPNREDIDERATALALAWAPGSVGPCRIRLWWRYALAIVEEFVAAGWVDLKVFAMEPEVGDG